MIKKIKNILMEFKNHLNLVLNELKTTNNMINIIIKHKNIISGLFAISTIVFGTIGFIIEGVSPFQAVLDSVKMFGLNFPKDFGYNVFLFIAGLSASITIFLLAVVFFIKDFFEKKLIKDMFAKEHTAVFGLGEINRSFLNSIKCNDKISSIVIIESNPNNKYIEEYKQKGFGVYIGDVFSSKSLELLNFKNMKNAIIALGDDRHNIEFSKIILDHYKEKTEIKLVVHIQNKDLEILFHSNFINKNDEKIHIKTFSFYEEVAKDLFRNHYVDGSSLDYISSNKEFKTVVIGNGLLLEKVLYQIALISHLPNENKHTVYIVDRNAEKLLIKVKKELYYKKEEDSFPTLDIKAVNLDKDTLEFYSSPLWEDKDLVNVIVANDEEGKNLDSAVELYNRVYLQNSINKEYMPKILFAIFDEMILSGIVNSNKDEFNNFFTYGNVNNILGYEQLIDEEVDSIAKLINNGYGDKYYKDRLGQDKNKVDEKWYNTTRFSDKLSSIAQSTHIDIKLKSLGLKRVKSDKKDLLKINQDLILEKFNTDRKRVGLEEDDLVKYSEELEKFWCYLEVIEIAKTNDFTRLDSENGWWCTKYTMKETQDNCLELIEKLKNKDITLEEIKQPYKVLYFPKEYKTLFENMIRMEHNRWNAYHYLNGWRYAKEKVKPKKEHDCLLPLKDFDKDSIKITVIYDIYSFLYLPNYLTEVGYEIVPYDRVIGETI